MSLSKDYNRLVYHMAKDVMSKQVDVQARVDEWTQGEMNSTDNGVIVGRGIQTEINDYGYAEECFNMFIRDVEKQVKELKEK